MEALQARINSFKKSKRVKNPSKPSSTTTLKWPHPKEFRANPVSLADAGFYYDPSFEDQDNVTCYVCEKELGGWEEDDDPFLIHWTKCGQTCCWANVRCGLMSDLDRKGRFLSSDKTRIPTHKSMEKARYETFFMGKGWIHDKIPNHGASSKMMARAGFIYTPQDSGDDLATCFYCNTSLSGWDAEDDPLEEHRKRENKMGFPCPFFSTSPSEIASSAKPVSRDPSMKPSSKSQGKPPSRSASRSKHQDIVQPTKTFDGELEYDSEGTTIRKTQAVTKTPRNTRTTSSSDAKKSSAKTPGKKSRSSSRTGLKHVAEDYEDEDEDETEDAPIEPQPPVEKKGRSRSKSVARKTVAEPQPPDEEHETRKPSRSRSKKIVSDAEEETTRKPSRSKAKVAASEDESLPKKSRMKSKSKAADSEQEEIPKTTAKPRVASRSKSKAPVQNADPESEQEAELQILTVGPKKKTSAKSKTIPPPAPQELFDGDVFTDQYIPPALSLPPDLNEAETLELSPLFIPKRNAPNKVLPSEDPSETVPMNKEKKKSGKSKSKSSAPPRSRQSEEEPLGIEPSPLNDISKPLTPVSTNPSTSSSKEKAIGKMKPNSQKMKVVEISSDEEPEEKTVEVIPPQDKENSRVIPKSQLLAVPASQSQPPPASKLTGSQTKREKKQATIETAQPISTSSPIPPPDDLDVSMASVEPENESSGNVPVTPPRLVAEKPPQDDAQRASTPEGNSMPTDQLYIPALSKLPFTPLHTLTEPELDMTVEEWIRYQMDVEFDKFRRDGERELQRFRKRAEEVRKVIEGL